MIEDQCSVCGNHTACEVDPKLDLPICPICIANLKKDALGLGRQVESLARSLDPLASQATTSYSAEILLHPLYSVFLSAIDQAAFGKGTRHGGCSIPFLEQDWFKLAKTHGRGFLTGQAAKKLNEAVARDLHGEEFEREVYGALVYIGMALIFEQETFDA